MLYVLCVCVRERERVFVCIYLDVCGYKYSHGQQQQATQRLASYIIRYLCIYVYIHTYVCVRENACVHIYRCMCIHV